MMITLALLVSYLPFNVTSSGVLRTPKILPQTTDCTEKVHVFSLVVSCLITYITDVDVLRISLLLVHVPQSDTVLYCSVEQSVSTGVQLKIS